MAVERGLTNRLQRSLCSAVCSATNDKALNLLAMTRLGNGGAELRLRFEVTFRKGGGSICVRRGGAKRKTNGYNNGLRQVGALSLRMTIS